MIWAAVFSKSCGIELGSLSKENIFGDNLTFACTT